MPEPLEPTADDSLVRLRRLVSACERFEEALRAGESPRVEDYLAEAPTTERAALRGELNALAESLAATPRPGTTAPATEVAPPAGGGGGEPTRTVPLSPSPNHGHGHGHGGELPAGSTLGRYVIDKPIGRGGMSVVYLAWDTLVQRPVALKVLQFHGRVPGESTHRFQVEMWALGRLNLDRVVPIYDVGEDRGRHFLVMRYFPDGSLTESLREAPLPDRAAAALMAKVAWTVHDLHAQKIIHRDLKPSNILLDDQGEPYVGDFGLAKILGDDPELTHSAALLGTPSYMAPEQAANPRAAREPADIYSLGATLYRVVASRPPFQAVDPIETLRQVRDDEPPPLRKLNPAISRDLETVCLKCLEKNPKRRFASAGALAEELERIARGEPIRTRPLARRQRLARWAARHRLVATLLGLVVALTVVSLVALALLWQNAESSRRRLERDRYFDRVALAAAALAANRTDRVEPLLADCPEALRDREWWMLRRLRDTSPIVLNGDEPPGALWALAFRSHGAALVAVGRRGFARAWEAGSWQPLDLALPDLPAETDLRDVAWIADDEGRAEHLAVAAHDGRVHLWARDGDGDAWDARPLPARHAQAVHCLAASARTGRLISGGDDGRVVAWETADGRATVLARLGQPVWDVALAPDGRTYAATGEDRRVWVGRVGEAPPRVLGRLGATGTALAFSPDGRWLASATGSGAIRIWDLRRGSARRLEGHLDHVGGLAFSPDGRRLASAGADGFVKLWVSSDGREALSLKVPRPAEAVAFSPDGRYLAASDDDVVTVWDAAPAEPAPEPPHVVLRRHEGTIVSLAADGGSRLLASTGNDGTVRLWDLARRTSVVLLDAPGDPLDAPGDPPPKINAVAFRGDGPILATGGRDNLVRLWDVEARAVVARLVGPRQRIGALACSRDGRWLASGDGAGAVLLWDLAGDADDPPRLLGRQPDEIYALAFHPDGTLVATAGADRAVWLWDLGGAPPVRLDGHDAGIEDLAFSRDGHWLASAGNDRAVILWDVAARAARHRLEAHASRVWALAFSPDGATLATGGGDWAIRLWDVATGRKRRELRGHTAHVCAAVFTPDGRWLATGGGDHTVRLWPAATWDGPAR